MEKNDVVYVDTNSILVSTGNKKLARIKCPFDVQCIRNVDDILLGMMKTVWAVHPSAEYRLVYRIEGKLYAYSDFRLSL